MSKVTERILGIGLIFLLVWLLRSLPTPITAVIGVLSAIGGVVLLVLHYSKKY